MTAFVKRASLVRLGHVVPQHEDHPMFDFLFVKHFETLRDFAAVGFVAWLTWLVARHGAAWVWTKAQSAWSSLTGDVTGLVSRVEALEGDVAAIKAVVPVPTKPVAVAPAPKVAPVASGAPVAPGPAPAPVAPAPVAPAVKPA